MRACFDLIARVARARCVLPIAAVLVLALPSSRAQAQYFGYGYPGYGFGSGFGFPGAGFGYGDPGYGFGYPALGGYGYPGFGFGYGGLAPGIALPGTLIPIYGYGGVGPGAYNPMFGLGLTPLGTNSALMERYMLGSGVATYSRGYATVAPRGAVVGGTGSGGAIVSTPAPLGAPPAPVLQGRPPAANRP